MTPTPLGSPGSPAIEPRPAAPHATRCPNTCREGTRNARNALLQRFIVAIFAVRRHCFATTPSLAGC